MRHLPTYHAPGCSLLRQLAALLVACLCASCNITKFVPENEQLLYKVRINVDGTKDIAPADLKHYLRQTQNNEVLGFWKLQLHLYNTAPKDTVTKSQKLAAANARKVGEPPVIYRPELTAAGIQQIKKAMQNEGFFRAGVDTATAVKDRKVWLTYNVHAHEPYTIRRYTIDLDHPQLADIAYHPRRKIIEQGMRYSTQALDDERDRITKRMRNRGYYFFDKEYLHYTADSAYGTREVDVTLHLNDYLRTQPDSLRQVVFRQYTVSKVCFYMDIYSRDTHDSILRLEERDGYEFRWRGKRLLRSRTLIRQCLVQPGKLYSERLVTNTYANLNSLGPVRYSDIRFEPVSDSTLVCHVYLSRSKMNSFMAEVEGTYSSDAWGIDGKISYTNKNIFRGAEELKISGGAQYEWRHAGGRAFEARGEVGLSFPSHWRTALLYSYQNRPEEYTRNIFNAGLYYTIHKPYSRWTHRFNVLDISYIYLPYISERFTADILNRSSVLRYSYQDHLIIGWSYMGNYTNRRTRSTEHSYVNFGYLFETAGNLAYGISSLAQQKPDADGMYRILNVPYSQYARADINFTFNQLLAPRHRLVYHAALGVAVPYLNSNAVPFEKRFFSGGANSVRGWQARTLGPGAYRGSNDLASYDLQVGDIRLDLNLEYRWRVWSVIELAAFTDAGNNWTIRDYLAQPYGTFRANTFLRQIAWSYGVGLRLDLSILLLRVDLGVKLYDPSRLYGSLAGTQWRTVPNGLSWKDDMTIHFAIGYPF